MQAIYNWWYLWIFYVYLDYNMVTPADPPIATGMHPQGVSVDLSGMTAKEGARENAHLVEQWERHVVSTWCKQVHAWIVPIVGVNIFHMCITIYQLIHSYDSAWHDIKDTNWYHIYIYIDIDIAAHCMYMSCNTWHSWNCLDLVVCRRFFWQTISPATGIIEPKGWQLLNVGNRCYEMLQLKC